LRLPGFLRKASLTTLIFGWAAGGALLLFLIGSSLALTRADDRIRDERVEHYVETVGTLAITAERSIARDPDLLSELLITVVAAPGVERALILEPQLRVAAATRLEFMGQSVAAPREILDRMQVVSRRGGTEIVNERARVAYG